MHKKILEMFINTIKEFDLVYSTDKQQTIELTKIWVGACCTGMTVPKNISTRDELMVHTKGLALWFSIGTNDKCSDVMGKINILDNKTNLDMEGLKHYIGTFEQDNEEVTLEDLIKVLFVICRIKTDLLEGVGKYLGAVSIEGLLIDNIAYNYIFIKKITEYALWTGIKFNVLLDCLILISTFEVIEYSKINLEKQQIDEQYKNIIQNTIDKHVKYGDDFASIYKSILTVVLKNFKKVIDIKSEEKKHRKLKVDFPQLSQEVLNNSYNEIIKLVEKAKDIKLPLDQYKIDTNKVLDQIEGEKSAFDDLFTNPKRASQLESGKHAMGYLLKDELELKNDSVVFKGHTEALTIGYTQKAVVLSLDKDIALRDLRSSLKVLYKYDGENSRQLIELTNTLITIVEQKKYANMIPFKAIAKKMGITKNEAKRYAKQLSHMFSIKDETFDKHFDYIEIHNFTPKDG